MKVLSVLVLATLALVGAFALGNVSAQSDEAPQMPEWMKPAKQHKELAESCGEFSVRGMYFPAPGAPAMEMVGTAKREMIMNGYYVKETFSSEWMGMPFKGTLIQGFDTLSKTYQSIWIESASPFMSYMVGKEKDGVITSTFEAPDPMSGAMTKHRSTYTRDGGTSVLTMYVTKDGAEHKSMTMTYTKKK